MRFSFGFIQNMANNFPFYLAALIVDVDGDENRGLPLPGEARRVPPRGSLQNRFSVDMGPNRFFSNSIRVEFSNPELDRAEF